ncbi:transposase [Streptomyces sp. NPDC054844]
MGHVEKWQLALDMIDETRSWGIEVPQVIADGGYGDTAAFRLGLEERGLDYVVGISTTTTAQPGDAQPCTPAYSGLGRRPVSAYPEPAQTVKSLVIAAGKRAARPVQSREGSRPPGSGRSGHKRMYSRFVAPRIRPAGREIRKATAGTGLPVRWLLAEWPADQDEPVQFWLSNLPETTPPARPRAHGETPVAHRERLPRDETGAQPGPLRRPDMARLAPPRHPRLGRPRLLHPAATEPIPKRDGVGLSLYRVVRELQTLLAIWTGACLTCHRDIPDLTPT